MTPRQLPIACSLSAGEASTRRSCWQALSHSALDGRERTREGARQTYRADPHVERELDELVELEAECCPFLEFEVTRRADELVLNVRGPEEAAAILGLFAPDEPSARDRGPR